jgi:Zn-dependent protease with chaperone function
LQRAQSEKAHRTNVKLAFFAVFAISLVVGLQIALAYAEEPWGLLAILVVPCASMFVFWLVNTAISRKRASDLHSHEAAQAELRASETEARVSKAQEQGLLDKWKS